MFDTITCVTANCLLIDHIDTSKNIMYYLHRVIDISHYIKSDGFSDEEKVLIINVIFLLKLKRLKQIVIKYGQIIANKIIECIMSVPPEVVFENIREVGKDLFINFPSESFKWYADALREVPYDCFTNNEKENFLNLAKSFSEDKADFMFKKLVKRCLSKKQRSLGGGIE